MVKSCWRLLFPPRYLLSAFCHFVSSLFNKKTLSITNWTFIFEYYETRILNIIDMSKRSGGPNHLFPYILPSYSKWRKFFGEGGAIFLIILYCKLKKFESWPPSRSAQVHVSQIIWYLKDYFSQSHFVKDNVSVKDTRHKWWGICRHVVLFMPTKLI